MYILILLLTPFVIFAAAATGILANKKLACDAAKGRKIQFWKASCLSSALFKFVFIWLGLDFVLYAIWHSAKTPDKFLELLIGLLVASPFFAFFFASIGRIRKDYWRSIADSLEQCEHLSEAQRDNLRHEKNIIVNGSTEQRSIALRKVLCPEETIIFVEN